MEPYRYSSPARRICWARIAFDARDDAHSRHQGAASATVSISAPANGASFAASAPFTVSATANSGNGVQEVEFFANGVLLGKAAQTSSPYSLVVSGLSPGSYALTVVAIDNLNLTGTSAPVHITLNAPGQTLIHFEALDASLGPVSGAPLSNYLAGYGVSSNVTANTSAAAENDGIRRWSSRCRPAHIRRRSPALTVEQGSPLSKSTRCGDAAHPPAEMGIAHSRTRSTEIADAPRIPPRRICSAQNRV